MIRNEYVAGQTIFKDYTLKGFLGEGGFGRVFLVENRVRKPFALKILHKEIQTEQRGVDAVMRIRSDRLISLLDYGETVRGDFCVLMEFVKDSFSRVFEQKSIPEDSACQWFREILSGLAVLEKHGIVHRDIKPSNLFLLYGHIKIGDFGTARYISGDTTTKTKVLGTIRYCAPECFMEKYDSSVDRWAASVILYRMFTGRFVFDGNSELAIFRGIIDGKPDMKGIPEKYRTFLQKCFEKEVKKRFGNVKEMLGAFEDILQGKAELFPKISKEIPLGPLRHELDMAAMEVRHAKELLYSERNQYENQIGTLEEEVRRLGNILELSVNKK